MRHEASRVQVLRNVTNNSSSALHPDIAQEQPLINTAILKICSCAAEFRSHTVIIIPADKSAPFTEGSECLPCLASLRIHRIRYDFLARASHAGKKESHPESKNGHLGTSSAVTCHLTETATYRATGEISCVRLDGCASLVDFRKLANAIMRYAVNCSRLASRGVLLA